MDTQDTNNSFGTNGPQDSPDANGANGANGIKVSGSASATNAAGTQAQKRPSSVHGTGAVICEDSLARPPWATASPVLRKYYDTEWGIPVTTEQGLYERLVLEGFQAGLSWATVLNKRTAFREAFSHFSPDAVAAYGEADVEALMSNPAIIRNRRKIDAAITNAQATVELRAQGGLAELIWSFQPAVTPIPRTVEEVPSQTTESKALAKALKKEGFVFVGPTTCFALMEAIGMVDTHLVDSHRRGSSGLFASNGTRVKNPVMD